MNMKNYVLKNESKIKKNIFFLAIIMLSEISSASSLIIFNEARFDQSLFGYMKADVECLIDGNYIGKIDHKMYMSVSIRNGKHELICRHKEVGLKKYYVNNFKFVSYDSDVIFKTWRQNIDTGIKQMEEVPSFFFKDFKKLEIETKKKWPKKILY